MNPKKNNKKRNKKIGYGRRSVIGCVRVRVRVCVNDERELLLSLFFFLIETNR